ncbi:unnamed protein product [Chironomus riparius]|uniref:Uncharacterized protein n=1 Tax=Chironomus riparius TaxID=315576 RepID=A0A9N9S2Z6_9DIPT|nr:unnamed protein product [Chironomus riparius]
MEKIVLVVLCLILAFIGPSTSTDIECDYGFVDTYSIAGQIYDCIVDNNPNILTEESAIISKVSGLHNDSNSNDDVLGIRAFSKTIQVFPKGLEMIFKNLKVIYIENSELKEIHQSDLKVFPDLIYFYLKGNEIEVIEQGLFDFNPNLELAGFDERNIVHIDPNVFDNLSRLRYFYLSEVPCVNWKTIYDSKVQVQAAIMAVKLRCSNSEFLTLGQEIENLEIESKTLNSEEFRGKLESFEKRFGSSGLSSLRSFNYKLKNLRSIIDIPQIDLVQDDTIPDINDINDKSEDLKPSQCDLQSPLNDLNASQDAAQFTLSEIKSLVTDQASAIDELQKSSKDHESKLDQIQDSQENLKTSQDIMSESVSSEFSSFEASQALSFSDLSTKISDIQTVLNEQNSIFYDVKAIQTAHGSTLDSLKAFNDEISKTLTDLDTKLELIEENLTKECQNDEIKEELELFRDILTTAMETKMKEVENRLMNKMEKILKALYIF